MSFVNGTTACEQQCVCTPVCVGVSLGYLLLHWDDFNPMGVDVGEQNFGTPLDHVDEFLDALPATLALPVHLIQEQRLQQPLPQMLPSQHGHRLVWEPERERQRERERERE